MTRENSYPIVTNPRKLNPQLITDLSSWIAKGNYAHDACLIVGIDEHSLYAWLNQAKLDEENGKTEDDSLFIQLQQSIKRARAECRAELVAVIKEKAVVGRDWLPAITYLERTDPDHWGRRDRHDVNIEQKTLNITRVEVVTPGNQQIATNEALQLPQSTPEPIAERTNGNLPTMPTEGYEGYLKSELEKCQDSASDTA